jgi:hypothetical protein
MKHDQAKKAAQHFVVDVSRSAPPTGSNAPPPDLHPHRESWNCLAFLWQYLFYSAPVRSRRMMLEKTRPAAKESNDAHVRRLAPQAAALLEVSTASVSVLWVEIDR